MATSNVISNCSITNTKHGSLKISWSFKSEDRVEEKEYFLPETRIIQYIDCYSMCYAGQYEMKLRTTTPTNGPHLLDSLCLVLSNMYEHVDDTLARAVYANIIDILRQNGEVGFTKIIMSEDKMESGDKIYNLIEAADKCRDQIVLCLMGNPGIGKTEAVERFARDHDRNVVHIIASQILPSEVSGMTMPNQKTHTMDVFDHARLGHMKDGDILFFDELLKGQQQVLNACLTLIQERRLMSGKKLPDVLIIAAANPLQSPGQLPLEIRQRFMFVDVRWNKTTWTDYMVKLGFDRRSLKNLADHLEGIQKNSNTKTANAHWNILTPRSATKLCLWLKASGMSEEVGSYILSEFDGRAYDVIMEAVKDKAYEDPKEQVANKIIELLGDTSESNPDDLPVFKELRKNIIDSAEEIVNNGCTDMSALIDMLQKLPEWEEVKTVLESTMIKSESVEMYVDER